MTGQAKQVPARFSASEWFREARFGGFIHWGLYSIPARGEWLRSTERLTIEEYQPFFEEFNPVDYDPRAWARAFREAGMKYAVLTAKHHDGFCLFDSALTDYKATNTPAGRDLVREYLDAFRAEGLKVGLYFSIIDWHHPDFPAYHDQNHPMRGREDYKHQDGQNFDRYLDYMHGQIRELCENYGKLDIMWFDFSYGEMAGEKWRATELIRMVRELQPGILIDNRLEGSGSGHGSIVTPEPSEYAGDFACPEQTIPLEPLTDLEGNPIPWESCITMNNNWGYASADKDFKPAPMLIQALVECVSKGGNLLLNVGPDARGRIPRESLALLKEIGEWMDLNSESIYGCGASDLPRPDWGFYTQKEGWLYAHLIRPVIGATVLQGVKPLAGRIRLLADGSEIKSLEPWNIVGEQGKDLSINFAPNPVSTVPLPDSRDTVVKIEVLNR